MVKVILNSNKPRLPICTISKLVDCFRRQFLVEMSEDDGERQYTEKDYTLIFCRRENSDGQREILLGMKKRGFGVGKWNGFGGKVEGEETIEQGALRELEEESTLKASNMKRVGYLVFKMLETAKIMRVHVFDTWSFEGTIVETEEMRPKWFLESEIPYDKMWADDPYWLPLILQGKSFVGR